MNCELYISGSPEQYDMELVSLGSTLSGWSLASRSDTKGCGGRVGKCRADIYLKKGPGDALSAIFTCSNGI